MMIYVAQSCNGCVLLVYLPNIPEGQILYLGTQFNRECCNSVLLFFAFLCFGVVSFLFLVFISLLKPRNIHSGFLQSHVLHIQLLFLVVEETQILNNVALNDAICPVVDVESHLILAQIQPASHMYRFACSHQGATHLGQSFYFSIWPLFSSTRAAGGATGSRTPQQQTRAVHVSHLPS